MEHQSRASAEDTVRSISVSTAHPSGKPLRTAEIAFASDDGTMLFGKLTTPVRGDCHPVVVWVQTAEAQTAEIRVELPDGKVIEYLNLSCVSPLRMPSRLPTGRPSMLA